MTKVVPEEIKRRRRINVMRLKSIIAKLKVLLLAALIFVPARAWAGGIVPLGVADTDNDVGALMLFGVYDQRDGNTWIQLTNTAQVNQWFHVQIFDVSQGCDETDFYDLYTPFDTHVYDFGDFDSNKTGDQRVFSDTSYGFMVITPVTGSGGNFVIGSALGNVRIIRDEGYEYRTNLNGVTLLSAVFDALGVLVGDGLNANYAVPFNDANGNSFSDVWGIAVLPGFDFNTFTGTGTVSAGGNIFAGFSASIFDQNENPESCTPVAFACNLDSATLRDSVLDTLGSNFTLGFDLGISNAYPASRVSAPDGDHICSGLQDVGQLRLEFGVTTIAPPAVVFSGFYGLNNGDGEGSMDSFISLPFDSIGFVDVFGIQPIINQLCALSFISCP